MSIHEFLVIATNAIKTKRNTETNMSHYSNACQLHVHTFNQTLIDHKTYIS